MAEVDLYIRSKLDKQGFSQAAKEMAAIERQQIAATRRQLAEHHKIVQLTAKLDRDLAKERAAITRKSQERQASIDSALGTGAAIGGAALAAAVDFSVKSVGAARESAAAENELRAALNSTGQAAGKYKEELEALSSELERNSNFSDEAVQHAESVLLTFNKIGRETMPRATRAAADLAEMLDGDLQSASIQIGKAMQGQVSALERSGVSFTEAEKTLIKSLFDGGKAAEAQGIILGALEKQVGGQARAARDAAGSWKTLQVAADNFSESWGKLLLAIGDGGAADKASAFLDRLTSGADAWTATIENFRLMSEAQRRLSDEQERGETAATGWLSAFSDIAGVLNPAASLGVQMGGVTEALATDQERFAETLRQVVAEEQAAKDAAAGHAKQLKEESEAATDAAAAQGDLAKKLEAAAQARKNVAGGLLDIEQKATEDTANAWDDYFKEEQSAWKDHSKAIETINADSEKERVQIQKDLAKSLLDIDKSLAKDLAKVDKDLAKDKAKAQRDSEKQIGRMIQDAARQEKRERRQRQIDAKGDQRLFDFEMRQLAAEGEFNAILAAKERRAIELQINAEKSQEEDAQRQEDSQLEIGRARQDARDRLAELAAEAEDRRQMLQEQAEEQRQQAQEQALEEEVRRQEELAKALADEETSYQERMEAMRAARDEKLAQIEETKNESIAKLAEELTESKDLTRAEMEATIKIAEELGPAVGRAYAEGMNDGFEQNSRINELANAALGGGSSGNINPAHPTTATNIGSQASSQTARQNMNSIYGFANGGGFTVGGFGGTDSQLVQFLATPGERVTVQPPGGGITIPITVGSEDLARRLVAAIRPVAEQVVGEYHDEVIAPWSNGQ